MPYTRITPTKNGAASLLYALGAGRGHNKKEVRNQIVSGVNLFPGDSISYIEQMKIFWNKASKKNKTQTWRLIQSFSLDELNPENPDDIVAANELGRATAKALFPSNQTAVFTQTDGASGLIHNHLIICNIDMDTYRGLDHRRISIGRIRTVSDKLSREYVHTSSIDYGVAPVDEEVNRTVRAMREENKKLNAQSKEPVYIWQDDLRQRIRSAADASENYEEFECRLLENGVTMKKKVPKNPETSKTPMGYITYELKDTSRFPWVINDDGSKAQKIPKNLRSRSYKLGYAYDIQVLDETFACNREALRQEEMRKAAAEYVPAVSAVGNVICDEPVPKKKAVSEQKKAEPAKEEKESKAEPEEAPPAPVITREEAEDQAKEIARQFYPATFDDDDFDASWFEFIEWMDNRGGAVSSIYNDDAVTGSVSVMQEDLILQYRTFISIKRKKEEEEKSKNLQDSLDRERRGARADSVLGEINSIVDEHDDLDY